MIVKRKTEAGNVIIDTNKVTMILRENEQKGDVSIRGMITPTYRQYEKADLCCVNEIESEVFRIMKVLFPMNTYVEIEEMIEGKIGYVGAKVCVSFVE